MSNIIPDWLNCDPLYTLIIIPLIIGIIASFFVVIFYDFIVFRRFYLNLCNEIDDNYKKIQDPELNRQFSRIREIFTKKLQNPHHNEWVGFGKIISIWILVQKTDTSPADYYRYLSNNDFKNFIQHGYYHYIKKYDENLTLFYLDCETLSEDTQDYEKMFNYTPTRLFPNFSTATTEEKFAVLEQYIEIIRGVILASRPSINTQYNNLHPVFQKSIFHVLKIYWSKKS